MTSKTSSKQYVVSSMGWTIVGIALFLTTYYLLPTAVHAQTPPANQPTEYRLLEPIPFVGIPARPGTTTAQYYIPGLFRLLIAIAGGLAVVRLIWAGFQYMTTEAISGKSAAKGVINDSLWGLLLALSAYVILYTVSPGLVTFNLSIPIVTNPAPPGTGGGGGGGGTGTSGGLTHEQARSQLEAFGYRNLPPLNGVKQTTVNELINLKSTCGQGGNCVIRINSVTSGIHSTRTSCNHANGYKADLDVTADLSNHITRNFTQLRNADGSPQLRDGRDPMWRAPSGAIYTRESAPAHWDMVVGC